jgi:thiol-disulfide isomerase/thioredoxin
MDLLLGHTGGRLLLVVALLAVASLALALVRRRDGVFRADDGPRLTAADLGRPLGARATLVQFSAPGCATCPRVRRVLAGLAGEQSGVVHVELDATEHPDLVRRLGVLRTPTVLVLGPRGEVRARTSGAVDGAQAAGALLAVTHG